MSNCSMSSTNLRNASSVGIVAWIVSGPSVFIIQMDYAAKLRQRTESGRPASSIRLRTATPTAASAC